MLGLEVFARAMNLPRGAVPGVFLLARTAGWVAHILEQYTSDTPLRPRAKFVSDPNRVGRFS
jgi:citrate synthase